MLSKAAADAAAVAAASAAAEDAVAAAAKHTARTAFFIQAGGSPHGDRLCFAVLSW
jgi:hypothetical protein